MIPHKTQLSSTLLMRFYLLRATAGADLPGNILTQMQLRLSEIAPQVEIASHLEAKTEAKRLVPSG
jgi:hypothetical protein